MNGSLLRFYVRENERQSGRPVSWWLLTQARKIGLRGGSAFPAMAGFGRHRELHLPQACAFSNTQTVEVEFLVTDKEADQLLTWANQEHIRLMYARIPIRFGC